MSAQENEALVRRLIDDGINGAFKQGDFTLIDEFIGPEYVSHNPNYPLSERGRGPEELKKVMVALTAAMPDSHQQIEDVVAGDDKVVVRSIIHGSGSADPSSEAPGRPFAMGAMEVFRVEDGKLVEHWIITDMLGMLQQVGAIPSPGQDAAGGA
jgi:predicted SnoaL-like aldol condensation-catalyzing enzyme